MIKNPAGLIMKVNNDSRLWLIINVTLEPPTATATAGAPTGSSAAGRVTSTCAFTSDTVNITDTLKAINDYRAQNNLPAYTINEKLATAAQSHANDMACNNLTGHTGSNGSTPESRVSDAGYTYSLVSENVQFSYPPLTGQGVVNYWINDKTDLRHGRNLVSDSFTEIGMVIPFSTILVIMCLSLAPLRILKIDLPSASRINGALLRGSQVERGGALAQHRRVGGR